MGASSSTPTAPADGRPRATSGNRSRAKSGNRSRAKSGNRSRAKSGHPLQARAPAIARALVLCLFAALSGCAKDPPPRDREPKPAAEGDPQAAAKVVTDMLAALREHDCEAFMPLLGAQVATRLHGKSCEEVIAGERLSHVEGARVGEARRDGRDPRAFMVPVRLGPAPDAELVLLRVEVKDGEYRVVAM